MSEARVVSLLRHRTTWDVGALLVTVVAARTLIRQGDPALWERMAFTLIPVVVLAVVLADQIDRRRWIAVGGVLLAVPPVVLADLAAGRRAGAIAVVAVAAVVVVRRWTGEPGVRVTVAALSVASLTVSWMAAGDARTGATPTWSDIVRSTGGTVRSAIVPTLEPFGTGPLLVWALGCGVVVAAAVLTGRRRLAAVVPGALAVFVVVSWVIERTRGPVAAPDGSWLLGAAIAATASAIESTALIERRIGRTLIAVGALSWAWSAADEASSLGRSWFTTVLAVAASGLLAVGLWYSSRGSTRPPGVNVVGYFDVTSGLGERARALSAALRAGGVEISEWPVAGTTSPGRPADRDGDPEERTVYDTTIAVVTALEFGALPHSHAQLTTGSRVIGYWFWELDTVPANHEHALSLVDEVWAPTRFVADAYRRATGKPVRLVPLPVPEPAAPVDDGAAGDGAAGTGDTVFLTSFDHLSVMERKHPLGAIEAFRRAFPDGDEPVQLVVKTINADRKPEAARTLDAAAGSDARVTVSDAHLTDAEHARLIRGADAFVSLHRSEGLGLQLADAMWSGTPVVASAYSGPMDFLTDRCAYLVPVSLVEVVDGDGAYPPGARWADADLDAAAAALRAVVEDPDDAARRACAAQQVMRAQPDLAEIGRSLRRVLQGWSSDGHPVWSPDEPDHVDSVAWMRRPSEPIDLPGGNPT